MTPGSSELDPVQGRAMRLGAELRRRRLAAGLTQQALTDRIGYDRSYLSQVETGAQVPAEQFILLCERELAGGGKLLSMFRELLAEREARRQEAHAERWRAGASGGLAIERVSPIVVPPSFGGGLARPAGDPSNSDMERRPFFRMLGVASGAMLAETLGVELWDLARAMQASNVSDDMLDSMEASVLRLHLVHAKVSPAVMLPHLHEHLRAVTSLLQQSQPIRQRRRLCSIAGHLAGLRGWATFDLADRRGASSWYELALQPAVEAEDDALCGWIFGAWSLLPSYSGEPADALILIRRAQNYAGRSLDSTVQAWLNALEARAHAGLRNARAFRHAQDEANQAIDHTRPEQRRHGMDFDGDRLDVTYYEGTSLVTLRQPEPAQPVLDHSLTVQGHGHIKAHSILQIALATTYVQQREIEQACEVAIQALDLPSDQRIGPIDQRARDLLRELEPWRSTPAVATLAERLATR
jgi:transcriptional regulator with XRE-family HTH domain